ncbi:MAG: thiol peroxidase [Spirochaetia bacterium]|nr:thiol peroxidase [Spirochaetia bacterium]
MATVTLKGNPIKLDGKFPQAGEAAPDFRFVKQDLGEAKLSDFDGKVRVIIAVISVDTPICAKEGREFNQSLSQMKDTVGLVVSGDLPQAMKRYCAAEGVDNIVMASQYRDQNFSKAYGTHIAEGGLKDLSARAVLVVDKQGKVAYSELVPEIAQEPNYSAALEVVKKLQ